MSQLSTFATAGRSALVVLCLILLQFAAIERLNAQTSDSLKTENMGALPVTPEMEKKPDPEAVQPPAGTLPAALLSVSESSAFSNFVFLVDKSQRTLSIWRQKGDKPEVVTCHPTDIGRVAGDKKIVGDHKTPEGVYFFQESHDGAKLNFEEYGSRIFTMDYPNLFDRLDKKTGYGIWLHAVPDTKSLWRGSRGCVVVRNKVIQTLGQFIQLQKTPIVVQNKQEFVTPEQWKKLQGEWTTWLETWRAAWESKNLDAYMQQYDEQFEALGMKKRQWRKFKEGLNEKYGFIKVKILETSIVVAGNTGVIRFLQEYESDKNSDFGEKTLHVRKTPNGIRILSESWTEAKKDLAATKAANATSL